jgi:hypothetical protein
MAIRVAMVSRADGASREPHSRQFTERGKLNRSPQKRAMSANTQGLPMIGIPTSNDLPPEVAIGMKLEGIFMPHARKQRDDFLAKSKRFVHYNDQIFDECQADSSSLPVISTFDPRNAFDRS